MKITPKQYAEALIQVLAEVPESRRDACFGNFIKIADANNDLKIFPLIIEEVERISREKSGVREATITTAAEISDDLKKTVVEKLERAFKAKIKLKQVTDPSVLGGMVVEFGNEVMDKSARTWISRLKNNLSA